MLARIGVWRELRVERTAAFERMRVWEGRSEGAGVAAIHFDSADLGVPMLGRIAENWVVLEALDRALARSPKIRSLRPAALDGVRMDARSVVLELTHRGERQALAARLVVGADGTESSVRRLAGIDARRGDYGQRAVVATVRMQHHHQHTAWQRFLADGPLALLPLPGDFGALVWSTRPEHAEELVTQPREVFCAEVAQALGGTLGEARWTGERASFPLRSLAAQAYTAPRIALVGDAAHTIHPLAGQGVNLGLMDGACLAELVADALGRRGDPGGAGVLRRYERWRKAHNGAVQLTMEGMHRLFLSADPGLRLARGVGLGATDRSRVLKRLIMGLAMGVRGDLPHAYRGPLPDLRG